MHLDSKKNNAKTMVMADYAPHRTTPPPLFSDLPPSLICPNYTFFFGLQTTEPYIIIYVIARFLNNKIDVEKNQIFQTLECFSD